MKEFWEDYKEIAYTILMLFGVMALLKLFEIGMKYLDKL